MAWSIGEQLTPELMQLFDGRDLPSKIGRAFLAIAVDEEGHPHCAMVSYGEVLAPNERTVRLALWDRSSTTQHLRRTGKATICIAEPMGVFYLKGDVRDLGTLGSETPPIARLEFQVRQVLQDGDPNGEVASGITYRSTEPQEQLMGRWERQITALREP